MEGFSWDDLRKILPGCQRMAKVPIKWRIEILPNISTGLGGRTNVRLQTDRPIYDDI